MRQTRSLRDLIKDEKILMMPGVYDSMSAMIAEKAGFKSIILGGYPTTASLLGKPDLSLLTLIEMVDHVRRIVDAVEIPVFVDGDTGHGDLLNVRRTVQSFEKAGVAGLFLEDQVFPKRCGHMDGKKVIPIEEMVSKIKVALDSRNDEDLIIMARTDARAVNGLDDAIERANLYREAGADLIFVEAPGSKAEMRRIVAEVDAPNMANMVEGGKTPFLTIQELADIGFKLVAYPLSALLSATYSLEAVFRTLYETGTTESCRKRMHQFDELNQLLMVESYQRFIGGYQCFNGGKNPES